MPVQVKKFLVLSIYFILAVSTLLVFWQVRNFDFINYDDDLYVYGNQHVVSGLTFDNIIWAFTTGHATNWHPLTWLSLMLDCQLSLPGGPNPGWIHLMNVLLHLINTLLLFTVLKKMTGSLWSSAFVAAAFALHPMHVESVAWIAERKDVLSTFFLLLTLAAYTGYVRRPSVFRYIAALALFAMGLMAKPMLVSLPFVLLLLDYWPLNRFMPQTGESAAIADKLPTFYRIVIEKVPFFVLSVISSVITFMVQHRAGAVVDIDALSLNKRIANAFLSYADYIGKMVWPTNLAIFYPFNNAVSVSFRLVAISALLLLVISVFVLRYGRSQRYLPVGWFWFVGTLIPVIGIVQVGSQAYADRYTYIPYIGLFIMLAWSLPQLFSKLPSATRLSSPKRKIVLGIAMAIVLTTLGICAHRQVNCWKNGVTLFSHALGVTQNNYMAYNSLGVAYDHLGRWPEAVEEFGQAIKIKPDYAEAHNNLGIVYAGLSRWQDAIDAYKQAIKIKPNFAVAYCYLGIAYTEIGRSADAIDAYQQAIKFKPDLAEAYFNLGLAFGNLGRSADAIDVFKQAIKIKPDYAEAYYNLGVAYEQLGRSSEKVEAYEQAIRIKPDYAEALNNLGIAYGALGRYMEAIDSLRKAIKIKPDNANTHLALGFIYLLNEDKDSAMEEYKILKTLNAEIADKLFNRINQ